MNCPHCTCPTTKEQSKKTVLGYRVFRCSACKRCFNERTNTPFNYVEYPTDSVLLVVLWRLRYKLSLRDVTEMFLLRGWIFTHEAVRDWEARFAPLIADQLRRKRRGGSIPCADAGNFTSAAQFCRAFDEVRQFFRFRTTIGQSVSLAQQHDLFRQRLNAFTALVLRASSQRADGGRAFSNSSLGFIASRSCDKDISPHNLTTIRDASIV